MHPTRPQSIINELSGHASLLLSASPTIVNSPLQNNTNNTPTSSNIIATNPSTHSPRDSNSGANNASSHASYCSDDELPEDNINFKKPQNEIFKKLDGKIQRIVAAHSNLNKLYALNDFTSVGPRKPFELPAPLPRPPPWVPKVSSDYGCSQWAEETLNNLNRVAGSEDMDFSDIRQSSSIPGSNRVTRILLKTEPTPPKPPTPTIDSAISRLHQRRQQQQQQQQLHQQNPQKSHQVQTLIIKPLPHQQMHQHKFQVPQPQPRISQQAQKIHQLNLKPVANQPQSIARSLFPSTSRSSNQNLAQFNSKDLDALNALIQAQKQQQQLQQNNQHHQKQSNQQSNSNQQAPKESTGPTSIRPNLTLEERRKFQIELINIFRQEIAAVTKLAKLKFQSPQASERPKTAEQKSLLLKKSPQSLFNTIRRETSLLLNRREPNNYNRSGISLLSEQQPTSGHRAHYSHDHQINTYRPNRYHVVKVVAPPTEFFKHACGKQPSGKGSSENINCQCLESKAQNLNVDQWCPPRQFSLKYRNLQMKLYQLKYIQRRDELNRKRGVTISMLPADARKSKPNPQKSLDKIVDRLQARCLSSGRSSSPANSSSQASQQSQEQSPEKLAQSTPSISPRLSHAHDITYSPPMSPKPIPVFRGASVSPNKGGYLTAGGPILSASNNKSASHRMKKAKRLHHFGLRLNNYADKDNPQPTTEKISVEQFAKGLNLVRSNDASLQRHQEKLMQSEQKWRAPLSDRPLRLRRIRGERVHMPPSASYRATRKVGLQ